MSGKNFPQKLILKLSSFIIIRDTVFMIIADWLKQDEMLFNIYKPGNVRNGWWELN